MNYVSASDVSKNYGDVKALNKISFEVKQGELFGFIGPDGAGKSSLFRILTTVLLADSGNAKVCGLDVVNDYKQIRTKIGYMPGKFSLYQDLTVEENLTFFATIFGTSIKENYDLVKDIYSHIEPFKDRRAGQLSGGMKQKLALSCALIHKPEVLFLDEPTTGVDPVSRKEFWDMLKRLQEKNITIIVSTPYMDEASLCDRVALIQDGNILQIDTPENIVSGFRQTILAIKNSEAGRLIKDVQQFPHIKNVYPSGEYLHYTDKRESYNADELLDYLRSKGHQSAEVKAIKPTIEDCFIALMSKEEKQTTN